MSGLPTEPYAAQAARWPTSGRHVLAHFDASTVVVYQAYKPSIGRYALEHGRFGGPEFGFGRMSWIKPNFLWMMYRSSWASAEGQEMVLGLRISRPFFDGVLAQAVPSSFDPDCVFRADPITRSGSIRSPISGASDRAFRTSDHPFRSIRSLIPAIRSA
jgi:hypothetical protein